MNEQSLTRKLAFFNELTYICENIRRVGITEKSSPSILQILYILASNLSNLPKQNKEIIEKVCEIQVLKFAQALSTKGMLFSANSLERLFGIRLINCIYNYIGVLKDYFSTQCISNLEKGMMENRGLWSERNNKIQKLIGSIAEFSERLEAFNLTKFDLFLDKHNLAKERMLSFEITSDVVSDCKIKLDDREITVSKAKIICFISEVERNDNQKAVDNEVELLTDLSGEMGYVYTEVITKENKKISFLGMPINPNAKVACAELFAIANISSNAFGLPFKRANGIEKWDNVYNIHMNASTTMEQAEKEYEDVYSFVRPVLVQNFALVLDYVKENQPEVKKIFIAEVGCGHAQSLELFVQCAQQKGFLVEAALGFDKNKVNIANNEKIRLSADSTRFKAARYYFKESEAIQVADDVREFCKDNAIDVSNKDTLFFCVASGVLARYVTDGTMEVQLILQQMQSVFDYLVTGSKTDETLLSYACKKVGFRPLLHKNRFFVFKKEGELFVLARVKNDWEKRGKTFGELDLFGVADPIAILKALDEDICKQVKIINLTAANLFESLANLSSHVEFKMKELEKVLKEKFASDIRLRFSHDVRGVILTCQTSKWPIPMYVEVISKVTERLKSLCEVNAWKFDEYHFVNEQNKFADKTLSTEIYPISSTMYWRFLQTKEKILPSNQNLKAEIEFETTGEKEGVLTPELMATLLGISEEDKGLYNLTFSSPQ